MLTIYRRHLQSCGHTVRTYRRCSCPVWVAGTLAGEHIEKSLDLTSIEVAEKVVGAWKEAGKIGAEGRKRESVKTAVGKFIADAKARNLKPGTLLLYEQTLMRQLMPWCEANHILDVQKLVVEKLREFRESWKCKPLTAARRIDRLRSFFSFCVDSGWMEKNPATAVKAPAVKDGSTIPFTEDELQAIYSACDKLVTRGTYGRENRAR